MAPTRVPSGDLGGEEEGRGSYDARKRKKERVGRGRGWKRGGCIETITPLLEAAVRVINDSIVRELFIYHRSGSSSCPLACQGGVDRLKRDRRNIFDLDPFSPCSLIN